MNKGEQNRRYWILMGLLILCILLCIGLYFYLGYSGYDIKGHWKICVYALNGYDPFPLIGEKAVLEWVGKIPAKFSTVPWACVFGSVFYGGFLPLEYAEIYLWVLHFIFWALTGITVFLRYRGKMENRVLWLFVLLIAAQFSFMYSLRFGNMGGIVCCMLIMSICLADKRPWLAGILLGFAMMKPQIAAIVCLVYLLNRKWKPLFLAAGIDIAGWIATGILTDTGIVTLLKETFSSGTASGEQYLGLLSFLLSFGWEKSLILILNVIIGIGYTLVLWLYLKKSCALEENALILYAPACIASTFWIYKNGTDYLILAFAAAFFVLLGIREQVSKRDFWICVLGTAYLEMSRCAVYLGVVLLEETSWGRNLVKSIDGFILGIVGVILCRLWVKYYGRNASYAR